MLTHLQILTEMENTQNIDHKKIVMMIQITAQEEKLTSQKQQDMDSPAFHKDYHLTHTVECTQLERN